MEDTIDQGSNGSPQVPQAVKTLGILSVIGSSLWGLLLVIALFWFMSQTSSVSILPGMGDLLTLLYVVLVIFVVFNILGIISALKMMKGNKGAFILYAIVTSRWGLLLLIGSLNGGGNPLLGVVSGIASLGFVVAFGMQMKNMPNK